MGSRRRDAPVIGFRQWWDNRWRDSLASADRHLMRNQLTAWALLQCENFAKRKDMIGTREGSLVSAAPNMRNYSRILFALLLSKCHPMAPPPGDAPATLV